MMDDNFLLVCLYLAKQVAFTFVKSTSKYVHFAVLQLFFLKLEVKMFTLSFGEFSHFSYWSVHGGISELKQS